MSRTASDSSSIALAQLLWCREPSDSLVTYEVQKSKYRTLKPLSLSEALARWESGKMKFFGVVPRKRPENNKEACVDYHDVLHADVDRQVGVDPSELLGEVNAVLGPMNLKPSAAVFSGTKGIHLYWRLSERLPIDLVQGYNTALLELLNGDPACYGCSRLLRVPGSLNEKAGGSRVEVLHLEPEPIPTIHLQTLGDVKPRPRARPSAAWSPRDSGAKPEWLALAEPYDHWGEIDFIPNGLKAQMWEYMETVPAKGWSASGYKSRSEIEAGIVYRFVGRSYNRMLWTALRRKAAYLPG